MEQVSWAFSKTDNMAPFYPLLSPKTLYTWRPELEEAFVKAKENIVKKAADGIKSFDTKRVTVLNTDWSELGISFAVLQKHCECPGPIDIRCCNEGWALTYCNSRFCSKAESRYSPVEGEALAVAWGL